MRSLKVAFFLLAFASAMALAQGSGEATFIRNVCDSLLNTKVTLIAKSIDESNWYGNPQGNVNNWKTDSVKTKTHASYNTLKLALSDYAQFTVPYSITANCYETKGNTYDYLTWERDHWYRDTIKNYATYIYDSHNVKSIGTYDSTNANNFLAMAQNKLPDDDAFGPGEILVSRPFELNFEWWFVGLRYELVYDSIIDGVTNRVTRSKFTGAVAYDSLTAFRAAKSAMDQKAPIPDTIKTIRIQTVKVTLVDSRKLNSPTESSSSVEPPKSSSSETPKSSSSEPPKSSSSDKPKSSSAEPPKSSSSQGSTPGTSSSADKPKSSSAESPKSSSSQGSSPSTSSSADKPKSSSGDSSPIPVVRSEMERNEIVEVRRLDGSVVKNFRAEKPGIYYVKTSGGTWLKKVVLPK